MARTPINAISFSGTQVICNMFFLRNLHISTFADNAPLHKPHNSANISAGVFENSR